MASRRGRRLTWLSILVLGLHLPAWRAGEAKAGGGPVVSASSRAGPKSKAATRAAPAKTGRRSGVGGNTRSVSSRYAIDRCEQGWAVMIAERGRLVFAIPPGALPVRCEEGGSLQVRLFPGWSRKKLPRSGRRSLAEVAGMSSSNFASRIGGREVTLPRALFPGRLWKGARFTVVVEPVASSTQGAAVAVLRRALPKVAGGEFELDLTEEDGLPRASAEGDREEASLSAIAAPL